MPLLPLGTRGGALHISGLCSEYVAALSEYRQRKWTCMRTGAAGLTYEEALASEANLKPRVRLCFDARHTCEGGSATRQLGSSS